MRLTDPETKNSGPMNFRCPFRLRKRSGKWPPSSVPFIGRLYKFARISCIKEDDVPERSIRINWSDWILSVFEDIFILGLMVNVNVRCHIIQKDISKNKDSSLRSLWGLTFFRFHEYFFDSKGDTSLWT